MGNVQSMPFREPIPISSAKFCLCFLISLTAFALPACQASRAQTVSAPATPTAQSAEIHKLDVKETQEIPITLLAGQALECDIEQLSGQVSLQWRDGSGNDGPSLFTLDGAHGH